MTVVTVFFCLFPSPPVYRRHFSLPDEEEEEDKEGAASLVSYRPHSRHGYPEDSEGEGRLPETTA